MHHALGSECVPTGMEGESKGLISHVLLSAPASAPLACFSIITWRLPFSSQAHRHNCSIRMGLPRSRPTQSHPTHPYPLPTRIPSGFPTIKLFRSGSSISFDGSRDAEAIKRFALDSLPTSQLSSLSARRPESVETFLQKECVKGWGACILVMHREINTPDWLKVLSYSVRMAAGPHWGPQRWVVW